MHTKTAVIFGGTGFVGSTLIPDLVKQGYTIVVPSRHVQSAYQVKTGARVGQVVPMPCAFTPESVAAVIPQGCDLVVNLIGVLAPRKAGGFTRAHVDIPAMIAKACADKGVARLVHVSSLSAQTGLSKYAKTKKEGEDAVRAAFADATILRPSIIFGPGDDFFNRFARMAMVLPVLPLIGGGKTKFQPVYVGDVALAIRAAAANDATKGQFYELGGPDIVDFKDIYAHIFANTHQKRGLINLPWAVARLQACAFSVLPNPPLTADQITSLKTDTVVSEGAKTLVDLGINATAMDVILPQYLCRYRPGGTFGDKKAA